MKIRKYLFSVTVLSILLVLMVIPAQGADQTGKWGFGLHGGLYKLVLTDHSDIWTVGWLANGDLKYGLSRNISIGVEGNWMQTYLADRDGTKGAGITFKKVENGPRQHAFLVGGFGEYHFMPDKRWSPFVSFGAGMYFWRWTDRNGKTLISADPSLIGTSVPPLAKDSSCYYMRDHELYAMAGLGLEYFPAQWLSLEVGTKFRYLTHLFTDFKDNRKIVGTNAGQLDLPKGIIEAYAGLTFYFGGKKECPPLVCKASGDPMSGNPPFEVKFEGSVSGGCSPFTYNWDFGDGGTSTDREPRHTYQTAGNFTVRLTVTDSKGNQCEESVSSIKIGCPPMTSKATANPASGPIPLTVQFSATSSGGCPPNSYSWDFGDGGSSSEQNPSHTIEQVGNYTARLTVTDSKGNRSQESVTYEALLIPTPEKPIILHGVNFEFDKSRLTVRADSILNLVAISLKKNPDIKVEIDGHCDWIGSDAYNQKLSIRRADAVRDYLIRNGAKADNLTIKGFGKTKPMADNKTAEGRALNRRVELVRPK
jgi:outer membrane protein OmpA-like peptidoglycan-associated protein